MYAVANPSRTTRTADSPQMSLANPRSGRLAVSRPGDPCEQEADRVAGQVMRVSEEQKILRKAEGSSAGVAVPPGFGAALGPGRPLEPSVRGFFEPRFGHSLSHVRIHTDGEAASSAESIGAQAYTLGRHIAFAAGEFSPSTPAGQRLIAHELAHVAQRGEPATIRRKIKVDPTASLDGYFKKHALEGVTVADGTYDHAKGGELDFEQEILIGLLSSPRVFHVDGETAESAARNLDRHLRARKGIVTFAANKKYNFAAGSSNFKMNEKYYDLDRSKGKWKVKADVDRQEAWNDLNENPELYAIACDAATRITMSGGSGGANIIDKPSGDKDDWVPGDSGYIQNTKHDGRAGYEGENIIYTGGGLFWGHLSSAVTYDSLAGWGKVVFSWNKGVRLDPKRELPATGLLDK